MSAQDNTERVLRNFHVLLSKSEPVPNNPGKVIVEKQQVLDLLAELNTCIYGIMDEYEMTARSRDKAEREFHRQGDQIIWEASRKAEDVYAASVMYTEEALSRISDIIKNAASGMEEIYRVMGDKLEEEQKHVSSNQSELKATLRELRDTEKYLRLIEDRNEEIEKEKRKAGKGKKEDANIYANRQTEVRINKEVLEQLGLSTEEADEEDEMEMTSEVSDAPEMDRAETDELEFDDSDLELYEGKETFSNLEEAMESKKKSGSNKIWKGLIGQKGDK